MPLPLEDAEAEADALLNAAYNGQREVRGEGHPETFETLFTFALVFTTLHVATTRLQRGNAYFGLVVATIVVAGILTVGPVASAVFNPAVQIGFWAMGMGGVLGGLLVICSSLVGGVLAALVFTFVHGSDQNPG